MVELCGCLVVNVERMRAATEENSFSVILGFRNWFGFIAALRRVHERRRVKLK